MMKKVKLQYEWWEAVLEINYNENTLQWMKDQVLFWIGGQDAIDEQDGDVEKAYLKMLGVKLLELSSEYNLYGVEKEFEDMEGWAQLDSTFGVIIRGIDSWKVDESEISVVEIGL